ELFHGHGGDGRAGERRDEDADDGGNRVESGGHAADASTHTQLHASFRVAAGHDLADHKTGGHEGGVVRLPFGGRKHTNLPAPQLVDDGGRQLGAGPVSGQQQDAAGRRAGRAGQGGPSSDRAAGPVP